MRKLGNWLIIVCCAGLTVVLSNVVYHCTAIVALVYIISVPTGGKGKRLCVTVVPGLYCINPVRSMNMRSLR